MMADPTIQTFCCHHNQNGSDLALQIMNEFDTKSYNGVCLVSSIIGIMGALYQIYPREPPSPRHSSIRGRQIIIWLATADLFASLGVLTRSIIWLNYKNMLPEGDDTSDVLFCAITSAWTQYFYMVTWIWTLCYAIDTHLLLKDRDGYPGVYHTIAWGLPAVLTASGLSILYYPNAKCHNLNTLKGALMRILPNYCVTYIPITVVMIANPIIYFLSTKDMEVAVSRPLSQITSKERVLVDALNFKFALINLAFYVCWLPNIINGVLLWTLWFNLPVKAIVVVWYVMALMNPLQALINALVYRRWKACNCRFRLSNLFVRKDNVESEKTPLLRPRQPSRLRLTDNPQNSINLFTSM